MAQLSEQTTTEVLELQRRLLAIVHQATAVAFVILEQHGEIEETLADLEQLDNTRDRADTYYSRFYTLLRRIAEAQPMADSAMLDLLTVAISQAKATAHALEATIAETKRDWHLS
jgi:thiamine biosynthesis lipoprotein ApbE